MMVVNLHYGHLHYQRHLERIRRSFDGAMLGVDDGDLSNSIVFACKGPALQKAAAGLVRRPKGLERGGADQLLGAFAQVQRALQERAAS
jgi:spermidine synthase